MGSDLVFFINCIAIVLLTVNYQYSILPRGIKTTVKKSVLVCIGLPWQDGVISRSFSGLLLPPHPWRRRRRSKW